MKRNEIFKSTLITIILRHFDCIQTQTLNFVFCVLLNGIKPSISITREAFSTMADDEFFGDLMFQGAEEDVPEIGRVLEVIEEEGPYDSSSIGEHW